MDAEKVIQLYIDEVVEQLPRRQRADIARELHALITDDLAARAASEGRVVDERMAVDHLRSFGQPRDIASRYQATSSLLDPADTRDFLLAAAIGSVILWQASFILAWLGLLVVFFAVQGWARQRWPQRYLWRPVDQDRAKRWRLLTRVAVLLIAILCIGAPRWMYEHLSGGAVMPTRLVYAPQFAYERLPWLLALWMALALLFLSVALEGHWRPITRYLDAGLSVAVIAVLIWIHNDGPVLRIERVDLVVKVGIECLIFLSLVSLVFKSRRLRRVRYHGAAAMAENTGT